MPINPKYLAPFLAGEFYHVYNRAPSDKKMFLEERNFYFFLDLIKKYLLSNVDIYAYCLIPNHFHLFIRVHDITGDLANEINKTVTNQFRKLFISYSNAMNQEYGTRGDIFQPRSKGS